MKRPYLSFVGALLGIALLAWWQLPTLLSMAGLHPSFEGETYSAPGKRALIITTSHGVLSRPGETGGRPTGVFASEMTHPYYTFLEAGLEVDIASIRGGGVPIDPQSFWRIIASDEDRRFQQDEEFQAKVANSLAIAEVDISTYDLVFIAGGWGAAYDLAQSEAVAEKISDAYYAAKQPIIGSVCHGALGLVGAQSEDGGLLIADRPMTGVTNKQLDELGIAFTPKHPETELRKAGALFEASSGFRDFLQTHVVVDDERRFVTGQNQNSGLEAAHTMVELLARRQ